MHSKYSFNFLATISEQLVAALQVLPITPLTSVALETLQADQVHFQARQGVYLLYLGDRLAYLGKADNVAARLATHLTKLMGRRGIDARSIGYKALLLDESMGTAANEKLLIARFQGSNPEMWNNKGFGPKDPGKERDTTAPSVFDSEFPIREDFEVLSVDDQETVGTLLGKMKNELPYVFRFGLARDDVRTQTPLDLTGVDRTAEVLLQTVVTALGPGWKGVILAYGMVLYETSRQYPYGRTLLP